MATVIGAIASVRSRSALETSEHSCWAADETKTGPIEGQPRVGLNRHMVA